MLGQRSAFLQGVEHHHDLSQFVRCVTYKTASAAVL